MQPEAPLAHRNGHREAGRAEMEHLIIVIAAVAIAAAATGALLPLAAGEDDEAPDR